MPDKKLKDNEITKALRCVPKDVSGYIIDENNKMKLVHNEDVLDLINRLQAELKVSNEALNNSIKLNNRLETQNKELSEMVHNLTIEKDALFDKAEESKTKVEKLNKEIQITKDAYTMLQTKIEIIKSEAVKEFADRLCEELRMYEIKDKFNKAVFLNVVDKVKNCWVRIMCECVDNMHTDYYIVDSIGGVHSDGMGWSPKGQFCGECTRTSCVNCPALSANEDHELVK